MSNWARWKVGVPIGLALSGAYRLEAHGRREGTTMPLLNGEAMDVDAAVEALPEELQAVVLVQWLRARRGKPSGNMVPVQASTLEQRARACGCPVRTYQRRLEHAHDRIRALLRAKRDEASRRRAEYRARNRIESSVNTLARVADECP